MDQQLTHGADSDRLRVVVAALLTLLLAGCSVAVDQPEGPTTGTGDNSAFSEAGVEHIEDERSAVIDLRGPLTADDLGATGGSAPRDVDVRGEDPVEVTVRGTGGDLVVPAEVIRVLIDPGDGGVQSIALFESARDADGLGARIGEIGPRVGVDQAALDAYVSSLGDEPSDTWLNGGRNLGFTVGLHPVHDPAGETVLEYQLTPPA